MLLETVRTTVLMMLLATRDDTHVPLLFSILFRYARAYTSGTTTATVLARAIFSEGAKSVAAGMNPMDLRRGINMAVEATVEHLKSCSKRISTTEEISQVGTISANGEASIGALLSKAMERVGKEGVITVQVCACVRMCV